MHVNNLNTDDCKEWHLLFLFPGVHSDIGGGYKERGIANVTLNWMIKQGIAAGAPFIPMPEIIKELRLDYDFNEFNISTLVHNEEAWYYTYITREFPDEWEKWKVSWDEIHDEVDFFGWW